MLLELDAFLIERVFEPALARLPSTAGRVASFCITGGGVSFALVLAERPFPWTTGALGGLNFLFNTHLACHLLREDTERVNVAPAARLTGALARLSQLGIAASLPVYVATSAHVTLHEWGFIGGVILTAIGLYFAACRNRPRPPRREVALAGSQFIPVRSR